VLGERRDDAIDGVRFADLAAVRAAARARSSSRHAIPPARSCT
jgi:hypothetical protein